MTELSGLVASRTQPVLWAHDDSGNEPNLYALSIGNEGIPDGRPLAQLRLTGAAIRDWEDIAIGPGPTPGIDYIYLGDIGDKNREGLGADIVVHRIPEPVVMIPAAPEDESDPLPETFSSSITNFDSLRADYPEGMVENSDALFVDVLSGGKPKLYVVTSGNGITTPNRLFRMETGSPDKVVQMEFITALFGGEQGDPEITGADMSPDGRLIILRSLRTASLWERPSGASIEDVFASRPCVALIAAGDADSEEGGAIGFAADSRGYYTSIEGAPAPLWFVPFVE